MKMKASTSIIVSFAFLLFGTAAFAAVIANDSILSQHIKEADGTTGQNTNAGSGIKTGHIQNGAATTDKIADGAVTTNKVADGAITDAKITGPISSSKIQRYAKVAVVAQSGGDYTSPLTAMNNLAAWCGAPSATNPCLLKILPGVYTIGGNTFQMQQYVDIEGSGENTTKITGTIDSSTAGTVNGASNAEIRFLTVANANGGTYAIALYNNTASPKISNVTITSSGADTAYGVYNHASSPVMANMSISASATSSSCGIYNDSSSPAVMNSTIAASGGTNYNVGVYNSNPDYTSMPNPILTNLTISAVGGSQAFGVKSFLTNTIIMNSIITASGPSIVYNIFLLGSQGTIKVNHSVINSGGYTFFNSNTTGPGIIYSSNTQLNGPAVYGLTTCVGAYNGNYVALDTTCR